MPLHIFHFVFVWFQDVLVSFLDLLILICIKFKISSAIIISNDFFFFLLPSLPPYPPAFWDFNYPYIRLVIFLKIHWCSFYFYVILVSSTCFILYSLYDYVLSSLTFSSAKLILFLMPVVITFYFIYFNFYP